MIPELGQFALALALAVAAVQTVVPAIGVWRNDARMMHVGRHAAFALFACVSLAFACQLYSFVHTDFSVINVAQNANSETPMHYRVTASWGSHEGSLLLWTLMQVGWSLALAHFSRQLPMKLVARVLSVLGFIATGFLLFMIATSNPFDRLLPAAMDGKDLNPLLQDPGMIFHPPLLYMGYVGFSVAFAFAVAALWGGRLDAAWCRFARPWTLAAWAFLTAGIALGSFWAYYELGWGGWWFWDPVENSSFTPWLVGTALIHSLAVSEKRGVLKSWTVLLALTAFSLSLLGTFLVRSGVLTSVHAFATDPTRGLFILIFLFILIGGSLALYAWRSGLVTPALDAIRFTWRSRESFLLANNLFMAVAAFAVLLGTLYPLLVDALGLGKISVGAPYFDAVFAPIMIPAAILLAIAPFSRWSDTQLNTMRTQIVIAGVSALVFAAGFCALHGKFSVGAAFGLALGAWVIVGSVLVLKDRLRHANASTAWARVRNTSGSVWGMVLAHAGIGVFVIGVALTNSWSQDKELVLQMKRPEQVGGLSFMLVGTQEINGPNYQGVRARVEVRQGEKMLYTLSPEKRQYRARGQVMTEAAIDMGLKQHVYVSLANMLDDGAWGARIQIKPYISWIWIGCVWMALGGLAAMLDRRYRKATQAAPGLIGTRAA